MARQHDSGQRGADFHGSDAGGDHATGVVSTSVASGYQQRALHLCIDKVDKMSSAAYMERAKSPRLAELSPYGVRFMRSA
jgi:hypothetical protein